MKAIADVSALVPSYRSKTEGWWAEKGRLYIVKLFEPETLAAQGMFHIPTEFYEPCRFVVPGGFYTPDFLYVLNTGRLVFVEVKGSKKQKGYRDARSKLRAAAAVYPFFTWVEAVGGRDGFELEVINA